MEMRQVEYVVGVVDAGTFTGKAGAGSFLKRASRQM